MIFYIRETLSKQKELKQVHFKGYSSDSKITVFIFKSKCIFANINI